VITLHLTAAEAEKLAGILSSYLSDLRMEIADTDRMAFRDMLKERKALLQRLIADLEAEGGAPV
jgi:hypothetical protein